jgi:hypothetical protein
LYTFAKDTREKSIEDYIWNEDVAHKDKGYLRLLDPEIDYSKLKGRVTDKRKNGRLIRIYTEHNNGKFLKTGDLVSFSLKKADASQCFGIVRETENFYITLRIRNFVDCTDSEKFVRAGTLLYFDSEVLKKRIYQAAKLRYQLLQRREKLAEKKKRIRRFIWSYDQQKMKTSAGYEQLILKKSREKQVALDDHLTRKKDSITLARELKRKLNQIDFDLRFYHVDRTELMADKLKVPRDSPEKWQFPPKEQP